MTKLAEFPQKLEKLFSLTGWHPPIHHVSLGHSVLDCRGELPAPIESGTLAKFSTPKNRDVCGILTATHVVKELRRAEHNERKFLAVSKPHWEIPNTSDKSIRGASGGGLWRLQYEDGVVITEASKFDCFHAAAPPALYDFLQ